MNKKICNVIFCQECFSSKDDKNWCRVCRRNTISHKSKNDCVIANVKIREHHKKMKELEIQMEYERRKERYEKNILAQKATEEFLRKKIGLDWWDDLDIWYIAANKVFHKHGVITDELYELELKKLSKMFN